MDAVPVVGSLCWVRGIVRFCGGLATTFYYFNELSHDELHGTFAGNFRIGTEWFVWDSVSLRADIFGRMGSSQPSIGTTIATTDMPTPFAAGLAVMGLWSSD